MELWIPPSEVQKVRQPCCQKVFEESGSGKFFFNPSLDFLAIKKFGGSVKEMIEVFLQNGQLFYPYFL